MPKKIKIEIDFDIEETVFLKTDAAQQERIVTSITLLPNGLAIYNLACGELSTEHYSFEITSEKDVLKEVDKG